MFNRHKIVLESEDYKCKNDFIKLLNTPNCNLICFGYIDWCKYVHIVLYHCILRTNDRSKKSYVQLYKLYVETVKKM